MSVNETLGGGVGGGTGGIEVIEAKANQLASFIIKAEIKAVPES